jgi:hypothetical protein
MLVCWVGSEIIKRDALLESFTPDVSSDELVRDRLHLFLSIALVAD